MEVFSNGVVVTVTLFPLCSGQSSGDGDHHTEITQQTCGSRPSAYLENELHHFSVDQPMNRLSVDVGDEVTSAQTGLLGGAAILNVLPNTKNRSSQTTETQASLPRFDLFYPNNVVHAVYVTVADVDPYGPEREAVFLPRTVDGDGRARHVDGWTEVPAGR